MRELYTKAAQIAEAFMKEGERRKEEDQKGVDALNNDIKTAMGLVETKIKELEKNSERQ